MRFPPSFIERLRSHFLMSDLIGKRIPIKKHGREYHALCPFHNEKTPSFTINDEKGFFHCFGCGAHGDAIGFTMDYEKLTYPEAIERLARDAGLALPQATPEEYQKFEREKTLIGACEEAAKWFSQQLSASGAISAREYVQKRNLKPETQALFRIGYAPDSRTGLHQHLTKAGFSAALQVEAGLVIKTDDNQLYDRFRGRIIFPIRNASGKIIAFGGRILPQLDAEKKLAKYLNSPETPLFHKGEMLYNLDLAKRSARDKNTVVVLEGYMDVVSVAQAGVDYAVATLGTAVTPEHLRLLWQLAKEPVLCLDGDAAGKRAMMRAAEIALPLLKPGYSIRFAILPTGEDPDTFIQKNGKTAFEKTIAGAHLLSQVVWDSIVHNFRLDLPDGRAGLEDAGKQLANKITDQTVRNHYLSYFKSQLWEKTREQRAKSAPTPQGQSKGNFKNQPPKITNERSAYVEQAFQRHPSAVLDMLAQRLLKMLLKFPGLLHKSQVEEALSRMHINDVRLSGLRDLLLDAAAHIDIDEHEVFDTFIRERATDEMLSAIAMQDFAGRTNLTFEDAEKLWADTMGAYEDEMESARLQELLEKEWNEPDHTRLTELRRRQAVRAATNAEPNAA